VSPATSWRTTRSEARSAWTGVGERFPGDGVVVGDADVAAVGEMDCALGEGDGALADWTHAATRSAAKPEINPNVRRGPIRRV